jgi:hypothetical protein
MREMVNFGMMQYSVNEVLRVCCTWSILYLVYTVHGICYTLCSLLILAWSVRE